MIIDLLIILAVFVLGYVIFITSTYLLAKWMLPKIGEEEEDFSFREANERTMSRMANQGRQLAKVKRH